jgi:ketosteroid isomerase-like protein
MRVAITLQGLTLLAMLLRPATALAAPAGEEFSAMLMKDCIEAYSEAGARGDQKTADALLDEDVLFAGGDGSVDRNEKRDRNDAAAAMLKEQTLAMRRANLAGDLPAMQRFFFDDLLAIDENGKVTEGAQFQPVADLPMRGIAVQDIVTDWVVHHDGRTAVATYIDDRATRYGGQILHFRSRVIDTWVRQDGQWKLFATHATPLFDDAPVLTLPSAAIDAYAGSYAIGAGARVVISRDGETLVSSMNGGKPTRYAAELPDVFYAMGSSPGSARTRLYFRRNAAGRVTGYASSSGLTLERDDTAASDMPAQSIESQVLPAAHLVAHRFGDTAVATFIHERVTQFYGQTLHTQYRSTETWVKRGDTWKMLALQSRALENDMPVLLTNPREVQAYAGSYAAGAGVASTISAEDGALSLRSGDAAALRLEGIARDDFIVRSTPGVAFVFQRNTVGKVTGYVVRREGHDLQFVKIGA